MARKKSIEATPKPTYSLPETLFVYEEQDGSDRYFIADRERSALADTEKRVVGTYRLIEVGELQQQPKYDKTSY